MAHLRSATVAMLAAACLLLLLQASPAYGQSGTGRTTRYWDCCKPSCSWPGKARVSGPVRTCSKTNGLLTNFQATSGCQGGPAFTCNNQQPWAVNSTFAYGFAAVRIAGQRESNWCCACYELRFLDGAARGKRMVVQATNTGGDLSDNHFDLAFPGGGQGYFSGCTRYRYAGTTFGQSWRWGAQYGGLSRASDCQNLPSDLQAGCRFRWTFGNLGGSNGIDNPRVSWRVVSCPRQLTDRSGCRRT